MNTSDQVRKKLMARARELEEEINRTDRDALDAGDADVQDPVDYVTSSTAKSASLEVGTIEFRALQDVRDAGPGHVRNLCYLRRADLTGKTRSNTGDPLLHTACRRG